MSVLRSIKAMFGQSDFVSRTDSWVIGAGGLRTDTGLYVSEQMALNLPVVYACVGLISDTLAMLPAVVETVNEATGATTPVNGDPRELALNVQPNDYMTPFTARQTVQSHCLLWGNGYFEIVRNGAGQAMELWPIPAASIRPTLVQAGSSSEIRYQGSVGGQQFDRPASEVLHIRGLGAEGLVGHSPISLARQALGLGLAMEKYGAKLFANDARSGGWVSHPDNLSDNARKNLELSLNSQSGLERAHTIKILEEGMTFTPGSIPPDDAQFLGSREFTIAEFARMYRVPLELLQAQGKTSSWGSGIEQLFLAFVGWTLRPWSTQWEQEMTLKLLTRRERESGMRVRFSVKELLRGDSTARAGFYERMHAIKAMTVNEIRAEEGRNPLPDGDEFPEETQPAPMTPDRIREEDVMRKEDDA